MRVGRAGAGLRVAGQHARATQRRYARRAVAGIVIAIVVLFGAIGALGLGWPAVGVDALVIAALVIIESSASPLVDRWGRGAAGEECVGRVLDELRPAGWLALHDVDVGRGNIDHVLVGPAGIYTIETKSHRGRINTATIESWMLRQAYAEAKEVERITGLRAEPLLVFSNAYLGPAVSRRDGVLILPARMLAGHLRRRNGNMPPARVAEVYDRLVAVLPA
jgi:hypothetical protein